MEESVGSLSNVLWFILCMIVGYRVHYEFWGKRKRLPPGPMPLPLLGNLHQMNISAPHLSLGAWGKEFGGVCTVWLGGQANVVVTDYELLRPLLTGRDADALAGRPNDNQLFRFMSKGRHGVILLDGDEWKEQRRFSLHILRDFGLGRSGMEEKINVQVHDLISHIKGLLKDNNGVYEGPLDLAIQTCVGNIINIVLYGISYSYNDPKFVHMKEMLEDNFKLVSRPETLMIQQNYWLRHLPYFRATFAKLAHNNEVMSSNLNKDVKKIAESYDPKDEPTCYTESYLQEMAKRSLSTSEVGMGHFSEWQLTMITGDMWAAGMETTVTTLNWALLYLIHHTDVQAKIQAELDEVLGEANMELTMAHKVDMPYLSAVILEVQRIANIIPINVQHRTHREVVIGGHVVPADTVVIPQIASVHLDPKIFPEPDEFRPARFLGPDGELLKADEVIPFSLGKRSCLGESLARMELFLILGSLLRHLAFAAVEGEGLPSLTPQVGVTTTTLPYRLRVTNRLVE